MQTQKWISTKKTVYADNFELQKFSAMNTRLLISLYVVLATIPGKTPITPIVLLGKSFQVLDAEILNCDSLLFHIHKPATYLNDYASRLLYDIRMYA